MTKQELKAKIIKAMDDDADERISGEAAAEVIAEIVHGIDRIATALERLAPSPVPKG